MNTLQIQKLIALFACMSVIVLCSHNIYAQERPIVIIQDESFDRFFDAAFSSDNSKLITGARPSADIWDLKTGNRIRSVTSHEAGITPVAFSLDDQYVLTGWSLEATLWDSESGKMIQQYKISRKPEYFTALF